MRMFESFVAIDWSGAKGGKQSGIALAVCSADGGPPVLVDKGDGWSRSDVLEIFKDGLPRNSLVGLDLGIGLPFIDCGAFFPGWDESPLNARMLWRKIDELSQQDENLGAHGFLADPDVARYFHDGKSPGEHYRCDGATHSGGRLRATEVAQAEMGCKPYSNFRLVGAAQVGKSSLTGMRMLHQLDGTIPVWPIDPAPETGSVIVEIYTSIAALAGKRSSSKSKIRTIEELNDALQSLNSPPVSGSGAIDDHSSDAIVTSAWLRDVSNDAALWNPPGLTPQIAHTEGWTFGAR